MTTLVVVRKGNMAAIAADSLTTFGDTRLSDHFDASSDKMVRYGETLIALCGSAAHQLVYENLLSTAKDLNFNSKAEIFETFRKLHATLKEQHFLNPKEEDEDASHFEIASKNDYQLNQAVNLLKGLQIMQAK